MEEASLLAEVKSISFSDASSEGDNSAVVFVFFFLSILDNFFFVLDFLFFGKVRSEFSSSTSAFANFLALAGLSKGNKSDRAFTSFVDFSTEDCAAGSDIKGFSFHGSNSASDDFDFYG